MDKLILYKDYIIEKVALNAEKARTVAKEIGVSPVGNWKWALKNLRNMHTGEVLNGKELNKAKEKMGYLSNNDYQKIKSISRKLPSQTEVSALVDNGKITKIKKGELRSGGVDPYINGKPVNLHTHPYNVGEYRYALKNELNKTKELQNDTVSKNVRKEIEKRFLDKKRNPLIADASGGITSFGDVTLGKNKNHKTNSSTEGAGDGDISDMFDVMKHEKQLKRTESIVSPNQDYQAVHTVAPGYKRSIFFNRMPRKER